MFYQKTRTTPALKDLIKLKLKKTKLLDTNKIKKLIYQLEKHNNNITIKQNTHRNNRNDEENNE